MPIYSRSFVTQITLDKANFLEWTSVKLQEANHVTFCQQTFLGCIDTAENENLCWQAVILAVSSESKMAANITEITLYFFEILITSIPA